MKSQRLTPVEVAAYAQVVASIIAAVRGLLGASRPDMTEAEMNAAMDAVIAHDLVKKALAEADAAGGSQA